MYKYKNLIPIRYYFFADNLGFENVYYLGLYYYIIYIQGHIGIHYPL